MSPRRIDRSRLRNLRKLLPREVKSLDQKRAEETRRALQQRLTRREITPDEFRRELAEIKAWEDELET